MVSTLEKRIMMTKLASKHTSTRNCKLCHGPLTSSEPHSPPHRAWSAVGEVDCHPSCLPFACSGCVEKDRGSYGLADISGGLGADTRCALCAADSEDGWNGKLVTTSNGNRRGESPPSPASSASSSSSGSSPF